MQEPGQQPPVGPGVCPFVALVIDRDRRADGPDPDNRCYAELAPRQRDQRYQADFCYSPDFPTCPVFLVWAARNAAEPAHVIKAARLAWSGSGGPSDGEAIDEAAATEEGGAPGTPEGGLFGTADEDIGEDAGGIGGSDSAEEGFEWVPASAWSNVPYDERAEAEAAEHAAIEAAAVAHAASLGDDGAGEEEAEPEWVELEDLDDDPGAAEDTTAPKVPAALPMRRRKRPLQPIRTRGSGEWFYADPPDREPLVRRRYGIAPPVLLLVLGLLVAALVVFMIPTLLGDDGERTAAASPSPAATRLPRPTPAPVVTPSPEPTATPKPRIRNYRVKSGDTLTTIALRFNVPSLHLQCMNGILNKNVVVLGARLQIPPEGYSCPPGWRRAAR